jgi:glycosyltransferase involved in cell wall biosynthesis
VTRIALLHPCYWPEVMRGSERYIHDLASGLTANGHRPELITSHPAKPRRAVVDGLPVTYHRRPPERWLRERRFDDYWTHVPFTYASLRRGDFDLAHAFYPTDALAAALWSRRTGRPTLFSVMGIPNPLIKIRFDAQPRAARRSDVVTVDSRAVADAFFYRWGIETRVVYPGVDLDAFQTGDERDPVPTILCPAPIEVARKRVSWLLDALPIVRRSVADARLLLIRPRDASLARELTAAGCELFDAVEQPEDLASFYRRAWVTALPSWGEAFGMVLIESLACGTPVVASDRDAFPEIVGGDRVGRLFDDTQPPGDGLARALVEALELSRAPATADACRARAGEFSVARTVDAFESIYAELLGF